MTESNHSFEQGAAWACAELIRLYDQPGMALQVLSGAVDDIDAYNIAPEDKKVLRAAMKGV